MKTAANILEGKLNILFPFYFITDNSLTVTDAGKSLQKLFPGIVGRQLADCFRFRRPGKVAYQFDSILNYTDQIFILESAEKESLLFRGQILKIDGLPNLLFAGSPWITNADDLTKYELLLTDFALHDTTVDMIRTITSKEVMMNDMEELTRNLERQKQELIISQEVIRKNEERFQKAAKATRDVMYDWDMVNNTAWVNDQHYIAFGYEKENNFVPGLEWWESKLHPDDHDRVLASIEETVSQKKDFWSAEYRFRRADGSYASVLDRALIFYSTDGQPLHCLGVMTDVSALKEAECELRKAKEAAEESAKTKSEFLANMSHEIRTPLNGIIGMTEMAMETELTAEQQHYIDIIKFSSDTLLGLINDILDFSKIDAGKLELSAAPFSLRKEFPKSLQSLGFKAAGKKIEFLCFIDQDVPDGLIGDMLRLQQVIVNLAGNAIKFTEKGEVILRIQSQSFTDEEAVLYFTVSDTGVGIPADKLPIIFEKFTQADASTSRKFGGTGLGLAITKRLVEIMGGTIWVESTEGKGSTFHFIIPFPLHSKKVLPCCMPSPEMENTRVLIVEDNKTTCGYLTEMCRHFNMKSTAVGSGEDALIELNRAVRLGRPYSLVLLDITLPGQLDGLDVAESIKNNAALKDTEIIVITISQKPSDRQRFSLMGIHDYFSKPFSQCELIESIKNVLGGKSLLNENRSYQHRLKNGEPYFAVTAKGNLKILLAEDNKVNQEVAISMLSKQGYEVHIANNGEDAVNATLKNSYDLILMDVQMPQMNGYEATKKIRQLQRDTNRYIPIIGLTAYAMNGDRQKCIDAGMDDYLSKPVRMQHLLAAIDKLGLSDENSGTKNNEGTDGRQLKVGLEELFNKLGGNKRIVATCLNLFHEEVPPLLNKIDAALKDDNPEELRAICHGLRGALSTMEMYEAAKIVKQIEGMTESNRVLEIKKLFPLLKNEIKEAADYIGSVV